MQIPIDIIDLELAARRALRASQTTPLPSPYVGVICDRVGSDTYCLRRVYVGAGELSPQYLTGAGARARLRDIVSQYGTV